MLAIYARIVAALFSLSHRFEAFATRRWGRAGKVLVAVVFGVFLLTGNVLANTPDDKNNGSGLIDGIFLQMGRLAWWIASIISQLIVLFIGVATNVMLYNSFSNNRVVSAGWAIVRDTVNMFFVIVLIIIAFGTIFGHQRFQWQQQVPKLMIFALVINFSKTLCGIMIDFGQIVMLTFANAIREIAAGNFIQLLGLQQMYSISAESPGVSGASEPASGGLGEAFDYLASGLAATGMVIWVLATIIILTMILMYRVVMLWVLIILSPLAWFMGGAGGSGGIISSNAYAQWWDQFKCLVAVGPVLTFFLWLTLAVAGAGNAAATTGFDVTNENASGLLASIFEMDNFMSFLVGMAMLYAGFDAAQQFCSSMSGSFIGERLKQGQGVGAATLGAGIKVSAAGARKVGGAARSGWRNTVGGAISGGISRVREDMWRGVANNSGDGAIGKALGRAARKRVGDVQSSRRTDIDRVEKKFEGYGSGDVVAELRKFAAKGPITAEGGKEQTALFKKLMSDPTAVAAMRQEDENNGTNYLGQLLNQEAPQMERMYAGDAGMQAKILDFKKQNVHLLEGNQKTDTLKKIKSWDDVQKLSAGAVEDAQVRDRISEIRSSVRDKDGNAMMADEALSRGHGGSVLSTAWQAQQTPEAKLKRGDFSQADAQTIASAVRQAILDNKQDRVGEARNQIDNLLGGYGAAKTDGERMKFSQAMDLVRNDIAGGKDGVFGEALKGQEDSQYYEETLNAWTEKVLKGGDGKRGFDERREAAHVRQGVRGNNPYGEIPPAEQLVEEETKPDEFIRQNFEGASEDRMKDAASQIKEMLEQVQEKQVEFNGDIEVEGIQELNDTMARLEQQERLRIAQAQRKPHADRLEILQTRLDREPALDKRAEYRAEIDKIEAEINQNVEVELTQTLENNQEYKDASEQKVALEQQAGTDKAATIEKLDKQERLLEQMKKSLDDLTIRDATSE